MFCSGEMFVFTDKPNHTHTTQPCMYAGRDNWADMQMKPHSVCVDDKSGGILSFSFARSRPREELAQTSTDRHILSVSLVASCSSPFDFNVDVDGSQEGRKENFCKVSQLAPNSLPSSFPIPEIMYSDQLLSFFFRF